MPANLGGTAAEASEPIRTNVDVVLRDGSTVSIRPIAAEDEPRLLELLPSLSVRSRTLRFFTAAPDLVRDARVECARDADRFGLVALAGLERRLVGHASYLLIGDGRADVRFAIADAYQGRGLGTLLLANLVDAAER